MKGYSFRSLTDLVLKIFKTKVNAGTGLSGGGSLEADRTLEVKYGTAAGTATQGNDSRLSDSREWTAATISQAETEAGTATTRRAFTAQRVRQAIVAWFIGISGALGRTILTRTTADQVRTDIGLGSAATRNVGTSEGNVVEMLRTGVAGTGLGSISPYLSDGDSVPTMTGFFGGVGGSGVNFPDSSNYQPGIDILRSGGRSIRLFFGYNSLYVNQYDLSGVEYKYTLISTRNLRQTAGTSTDFPMSQAATTNHLATKANNSTQVIAGTGLSGGGSLEADRTLSVDYGTTTGTAVQGNDSRVVNALQRSNNLSDIDNKTLARSNLGLGSAATRYVGTSRGQVMEVGVFGLGNNSSFTADTLLEDQHIDGFGVQSKGGYPLPLDVPDTQIGKILYIGPRAWGSQMWFSYIPGKVCFRNRESGSGYESWKEFHHTGNILHSTGTSTDFPMSQAATTNHLATKANNSTQVIAGTGLTGGGTLAADRTLNVSYGTASGTAAQGNDSRIVNAVPNSRTISAGTGLTGGGNLTSNRTLSIAASHTPIGVGQTWQDVTESRSTDVIYTNTTGRPIIVAFRGNDNSIVATIRVGFTNHIIGVGSGASSELPYLSVVVPAGEGYVVYGEKANWLELR